MNAFAQQLHDRKLELRRSTLEVLQINVGRKCNQACRHCHVDAAPWRTEMMAEPVARRIGDWIVEHKPALIDLTGGAPELSEWFRYFVKLGRSLGCRVMDRNNLTVLEEPGFVDLHQFLSDHEVEITASLPCYLEDNVNRQRGNGVFHKSIRALRKLNSVGYGTRLPLDLVYNPLGPTLPPDQEELEAEYKEALRRDHGIEFHRLLTMTNQPIARFAEDLRKQGKLQEYLSLLANSFNHATLEGLMCRNTISVGYGGEIYDCDFNQMLGLQRRNGRPLFLWDVTPESFEGAEIMTGDHCLACAAGSGSSCGGALIE